MKNVNKWTPTRIVFNSTNQNWHIDDSTVAVCSRYIVSLQAPHYINAIRKYSSGKLLDCGCGRVPYYNMYKDLVTSIECIDWENSPHEIQYADKLSDLNSELPYKSNSFDTVILSDVLEHIFKPNHLISEVQRALAPGGKLICFVPFIYWLHEDPHDFHRYTEYSLTRLCEDNKMKVIELKSYGGGIDAVYDIILKLNRNRPKTAKILTSLFNFSRKSLFYKKSYPWGSKKLPLGYVLVAEKK